MNSPSPIEDVRVTLEPLSPSDLTSWATRAECGAVVLFMGTARSTSTTGHDIVALEYETSAELSESRIGDVVAAARKRWPEIVAVAVHHRIGVVYTGEPAVVVVVSSPHRQEAFEAAKFCIDTVKKSVPMWKREVWEGGSAWSQEAVPIAEIDEL